MAKIPFRLKFGHVVVTRAHKPLLLLDISWGHNPKVTGSNPVPATKAKRPPKGLFYFCMVASRRTGWFEP